MSTNLRMCNDTVPVAAAPSAAPIWRQHPNAHTPAVCSLRPGPVLFMTSGFKMSNDMPGPSEEIRRLAASQLRQGSCGPDEVAVCPDQVTHMRLVCRLSCSH